MATYNFNYWIFYFIIITILIIITIITIFIRWFSLALALTYLDASDVDESFSWWTTLIVVVVSIIVIYAITSLIFINILACVNLTNYKSIS